MNTRSTSLFLCFALFAFGAAACDAGDLGCRIDVECTGGLVCVYGQCVAGQDRGELGTSTIPDGGKPDLAQPGAPDGFVADAFSGSCPFNGDGIIQRAEIPAMSGLGGFFMASPANGTATVDTKKSAGVWDFSAVTSSDEKVFDGLTAPMGAWWASSFPTASYAQLLDASTGYLGIYKIEDTQLLLLGAVSPADGVSRTLLTYSPPIAVLKFPLSAGQTWTATSSVSGTVSGFAFFATETWAMNVDDSGKAKTPAATFDVLRLRVDYEQVYGFATTRYISYLFLTECYGTVTRIRSTSGETAADFTKAGVYRRLAAP